MTTNGFTLIDNKTLLIYLSLVKRHETKIKLSERCRKQCIRKPQLTQSINQDFIIREREREGERERERERERVCLLPESYHKVIQIKSISSEIIF